MPTPPTLTLGTPRFADTETAAVLHRQGAAPAWLLAWQALGAVNAAASATGDFAVATTDAQGRSFMAVDRFAVQTLCYRTEGQTLHCSERADTLATPSSEIDPQAIFDYLFGHAIASPRTIFKDVKRLPPAHAATFHDGRLEVSRYWTPRFQPERPPSFEALRDQFRAAIQRAVELRLDGSKPACFLSGGTDSSTVAGMIGKVSGGQAATFSIGFEAQGYDEMAFARIAAKHFGTEHHEYYVTPDDLVSSIPAVAAHHDQPFGNSSALPAYYCALKAREAGVTRLLAGDGGDELFGGNSRYAKQRVFGWYGRVPAALRQSALEPFFGMKSVSGTPLLKKGSSYIEQARVPLPDRLQMYNLLVRLGMADVLDAEFLASVDVDGPARQQREVYQQADAQHEIDRMLAFDWRYTLAESDLPKVRGSTQLAGVEVAYPFLDDSLLELSMRLPPDHKVRGLKLRWFFKEALRGFLPDEILTKKKQGFGLPFGVWVCQHEGLERLAADSLNSLGTRGIVRPEFIRQLLDTLLPTHPGYYGEMVWILMMLEQWFRAHRPDYRFGS